MRKTNEQKLTREKISKEADKKFERKIEIAKVIASFMMPIVTLIGIVCSVNSITKNINKQTQVVIEPRDGDIIVQENGNYKLLQLINYEDVSFPTKVQEVQLDKSQSAVEKRVDINNIDGDDWSKKDSFKYVINSFSINPNKVINLLNNIKEITVYCDFYTEKNISKYVELGDKGFNFKMRNSRDEIDFSVTVTNQESEYEYVTNELNNGIEWIKIRVKIVYEIGDKTVTDDIVSDWIGTDADIV